MSIYVHEHAWRMKQEVLSIIYYSHNILYLFPYRDNPTINPKGIRVNRVPTRQCKKKKKNTALSVQIHACREGLTESKTRHGVEKRLSNCTARVGRILSCLTNSDVHFAGILLAAWGVVHDSVASGLKKKG